MLPNASEMLWMPQHDTIFGYAEVWSGVPCTAGEIYEYIIDDTYICGEKPGRCVSSHPRRFL